jgi:hypothetical protein
MDIGPTELPIQPIRPGEGIRRVEGRSDAQQYPQKRQPHDQEADESEHEAPHDSVDVSAQYLLSHQVPAENGADERPQTGEAELELPPHLDIEA